MVVIKTKYGLALLHERRTRAYLLTSHINRFENIELAQLALVHDHGPDHPCMDHHGKLGTIRTVADLNWEVPMYLGAEATSLKLFNREFGRILAKVEHLEHVYNMTFVEVMLYIQNSYIRGPSDDSLQWAKDMVAREKRLAEKGLTFE